MLNVSWFAINGRYVYVSKREVMQEAVLKWDAPGSAFSISYIGRNDVCSIDIGIVGRVVLSA